MPALADALAALAALSVPGVRTAYPLDATPDTVPRGALPALLILPFARRDGLFPESGEGFRALAFSGERATVTVTLTHLLLVAPALSGAGLRQHLPALVDLTDAYLSALSADRLLGGSLLEPPHVRIEPGALEHGGVDYIACAFRHRWRLEV